VNQVCKLQILLICAGRVVDEARDCSPLENFSTEVEVFWAGRGGIGRGLGGRAVQIFDGDRLLAVVMRIHC
jgi:hypothetical protein